jgi:hypothetical protein
MTTRYQDVEVAYNAAFERVDHEIDKLINTFEAEGLRDSGGNWGRVGDLNHVAEKLEEINRFWRGK